MKNKSLDLFFMTINERIRAFAENAGLTQYRIAKDTGITQSNVTNFFGGRNKPSYDALVSFLTTYPNLNPSWLLLEKGEMLTNVSGEMQGGSTHTESPEGR